MQPRSLRPQPGIRASIFADFRKSRPAGGRAGPQLRIWAAAFSIFATAAAASAAGSAQSPPKPGFVLHFDFIASAADGRALVGIARRAGAKVINLVPPAHVWEDPNSLAALDQIIAEVARLRLSLVITRIDASMLSGSRGERLNYLYDKILNETGRFPDGKATPELFLSTVGQEGYAEWMEEEIRYYARRYGRLPNLLGINLGPFSEPDTAQRCGFFEYREETKRYEITQYTPAAESVWHRWLGATFPEISALNREYGATFASFEAVPLPMHEQDRRFGRSDLAYFDFARCLNDWLVERYRRCRAIWHEVSGRSDIPLIFQFNGGAAEKFVIGRPAFAAFDLAGWVDMADALGVSIYTNSGFPDMGHASIIATLNLIAVARDLGKDVFVLEGGNEAPNVTLDPVQLAFFGRVARHLAPRTYVYEFLKDKFEEEHADNPGKVVRADGTIRRPAFEALRDLFRQIEAEPVAAEKPALYVLADSLAARGNAGAGELNAALLDLASSLPIRWIPKGREKMMPAGIPVLRSDGSISPVNESLSRLLISIPPFGSIARAKWRREFLQAFGR